MIWLVFPYVRTVPGLDKIAHPQVRPHASPCRTIQIQAGAHTITAADLTTFGINATPARSRRRRSFANTKR